MKRLSELVTGQRARVQRVATEDARGIQILEMGVTPGTEIVLVGVAPLGDPLEFELRGYRLSLRKVEAALVDVELL
ncbi:MAG: FeoA domain-containing protein [Pirellulales bacterium]|nr:FeoA domain-containing protein [Pirellulales bacterium]